MSEVVDFGDDVHGQQHQGGWSQPRYERSVENEVDEHLRRTARVLLAHEQRRPFVGLLVGAPVELRNRFAERLHPYVRERLVGYIDVDVEHADAEQVRVAAARLIEQREERGLEEDLEHLRAALGRHDGRAATGADAVFEALEERRVEALLFRRGLTLAGGVCPQCGLISTSPGACRIDGTPIETRENAVEAAVEAALEQSARVRELDGPELDPIGGIAALLRF
jgi:peptide chain release factor subunit 1